MTELTQQRKEFEAWAALNTYHLQQTDGFYASPYAQSAWEAWQAGRSSLESENARLREALRHNLEIADYRKIIRWMQANNVKIDESLETPRGKFVFTLYSYLAEITTATAEALGIEFPRCKCGTVNDCAKDGFIFDGGVKADV